MSGWSDEVCIHWVRFGRYCCIIYIKLVRYPSPCSEKLTTSEVVKVDTIPSDGLIHKKSS